LGKPHQPPGAGREILFEFNQIGASIRVSAIDTRTNTEVTVVGARGVAREALMRLARRKLDYVLAKREGI
jgi:Domain of unknown function (DUF6898)